MTVLLGGGLLLKPALTLSQLVIDVDKSWQQGAAVAHSPAWEPTLYGWQDRKKITVTGSVAGLLTNYQMTPLTVHYGSGLDAGSDVYLNYKSLPDFADIRFTNNAGAPLFYWVESYTYGVSARVWVRFDSIPASPATVDFWIYFNNGLAISASYGDGTFIFFDHFDGPFPGTKWTGDTAQGSVASSILTVTGSGAWKEIKSAIPSGQATFAVRAYIKFNSGKEALWGVRKADGTHYADLYWAGGVKSLRSHDGGAGTTVVTNFTQDAYKTMDLLIMGGTNFRALENGIELANSPKITNPPNSTEELIEFAVFTAGATFLVDWILLRNYTPNEPTFSAYGPDELYETFYGITSLKELAAAMIKGDMLFSNGATLAKIAAGSIGSILTTHDVGADPTWTYPP
jgi:hypothetical protein